MSHHFQSRPVGQFPPDPPPEQEPEEVVVRESGARFWVGVFVGLVLGAVLYMGMKPPAR